ncbi:MAG: two-component system torCAD operon response regulator TorR [Parasphingorhabdus sp.]|jgi:two-component system torCAD operon response regulator TorR
MSLNCHLLLVEDEPVTRRRMAEYFRNEGFLVSEATDGNDMRRMLSGRKIDLVLLDLNLPGEDGLSLARSLRVVEDIAIIMVTGRNDDVDRIVGLEIGADDYVTKPFNPRELLARVKNVLRRTREQNNSIEATGTWCFSGWTLNLELRQLTKPDGQLVELTRSELDLLSIFVRESNRTQSRERLMPRVAHREWSPQDRTIDVLVRRLRKKLEDDPANPQVIQTIHGEGYRFGVDVKEVV